MSKKRLSGEGAVRRREDGRWEARVSLGHVAGKRLRPSVYGRTAREVREKMDKIKRDYALGVYIEGNYTVEQHLSEWLSTRAPKKNDKGEYLPGRLKPSTYHRKYRFAVSKHLIPRIGQRKLIELSHYHVQRLFEDIATDAGTATANNCRTVLNAALNQAILWRRLVQNPVKAVKRLPEKKREMILWSPEQAAAFLKEASKDRLYAFWYLSLATGMRRGELLGLRWEDVGTNVLRVRQTLSAVEGELLIMPPKSDSSTRDVFVTEDVMRILEIHRAAQERERDFLGAAWTEEGLVFTNELGQPIHPDSVHKMRYRLMDQAGVPRVRLHDLRHLHASIAIKNGVDAKVLADRLGHSKVSLTLDVYTHLYDEQREKAAVSLLDFLPEDN